MRGWTSSIGGALLVGVAMWMLAHGNSDKMVLLLAAGALVLFYRGYQGLTITEAADDAALAASFVAVPKETAMDLAFDRVGNIIGTDEPSEGPTIDVEAIMDRYLEERSKNPPAASAGASPAPAGFGRKGI